MIPPLPRSTLFPYTTLFRSVVENVVDPAERIAVHLVAARRLLEVERGDDLGIVDGAPDRKSTRLNSSHVEISYAVFCLKKKIVHITIATMRNLLRRSFCAGK